MTKEQYERWQDFATRMARTCFWGCRRPTSDWIIKQVNEWFYWRDYQKDWGNYNSWDQDRYPLCDHVSEFYDNQYPFVRCKACRHDNCLAVWPHYKDACPLCELECRCENIEGLAIDQFREQWLGPIHCCIRAGLDMACEPSAGVVGFTAGDVRRMYPEGVPDWVFPPDERLVYWLSDRINGTFAELPDSAGIVL